MPVKNVQVTVDGKKIRAKEGQSILDFLNDLGKDIPYLCYDKELPHVSASCRLCLVEINGRVTTSCNTKVRKGLVIKSKSKQLEHLRKINLKFILESNEAKDYSENKMQDLLKRYKVKKGFDLGRRKKYKRIKSVGLDIDEKKCILCDDCEDVCSNLQHVHAFDMEYDSMKTKLHYDEDVCVFCGQCSLHCPTAAIKENDEIEKFLKARKSKRAGKGLILIAQTAPSVRASLGELFGYPTGTNVVGKMVTALRKLGFDKVFDVNLGADFTVAEEGNEFLARLKKKRETKAKNTIPMFTSCCPAWVKFVEIYYPGLINNLSTSKSPHMMLGKVIKTYYANKIDVHQSKIFLVSIMPCIAKKFEISRSEFGGVVNGVKYRDVDLVLTTRELARLIKQQGINFRKLKNSKFDQPLGIASGGGAIFGVSGGVMESSLRVIWKELCRKRILFKEVRGFEGVKAAKLKVNGKNIRIAVTQNLGDAKHILDQIKASKEKYHFVEVMACPGGCIGGGGQPIPTNQEVINQRGKALYKIDTEKKHRIATNNPALRKVYDEFLEEPLSKMAEKILHTSYVKRHVKSREGML